MMQTLEQVINMLQSGKAVCLWSNLPGGDKWSQTFHRSCGLHPKGLHVEFIDLTTCPQLLFHDEWPWRLQNRGFHECYCYDRLFPKIGEDSCVVCTTERTSTTISKALHTKTV